jgi:hypothetical protein
MLRVPGQLSGIPDGPEEEIIISVLLVATLLPIAQVYWRHYRQSG